MPLLPKITETDEIDVGLKPVILCGCPVLMPVDTATQKMLGGVIDVQISQGIDQLTTATITLYVRGMFNQDGSAVKDSD